MTLSSRKASGQGLCMCVSVGIIFTVIYVCESINLFMTLSSREASGQGRYIVFLSGYEFILMGRP